MPPACLARASEDSISDSGSELNDWRTFRRNLIAAEKSVDDARAGEVTPENRVLLECQNPQLWSEPAWAHAVARPETGGLLLATQKSTTLMKDERYWQLVIYVLQHSAEGSIGMILNRPAGVQMREATPLLLGDMETGFKSAFEREPIYLGGFDNHSNMAMMHGVRGLASASETEGGICFGGMSEAIQGILEGKYMPSMFKFFIGRMTWGPGELDAQVDAGVWICAAASRPVVLKQCMRLPVPLWKEVLWLMGDDYGAIAKDGQEWDE